MAVSWILAVPQFAAVALLVALAGAVLWIKFSSPANRSFALYLILQAGSAFTLAMSGLAQDAGSPSWEATWNSLRPYAQLGIVPCLVFFLLAYQWRRAAWAKWTRWAVVAVALAAQAWFVVDHCAVKCGPEGAQLIGPLALLQNATALASGAVGLVLVVVGLRTSAASAVYLVGMAFSLNALFDGALAAFSLAVQPESLVAEASLWASLLQWLRASAALPALAAVGWCVWRATSQTAFRVRAIWSVAAGAAAVGSALLLALQPGEWLTGLVLIGSWRIVLAATVALALVRHRLLGADVMFRVSLRRSTMTAAFLAVFFVVEQLVQNLTNGTFGTVAGAVAAGLLLFMLSPLQRLAERLATAAVPVVRAAAPDRMKIYREQAALFWMDGHLNAKDRDLLDRLRARLGLSFAQAAKLEQQAARNAVSSGAAALARRPRDPGGPKPVRAKREAT